jgi:hypothetical protein
MLIAIVHFSDLHFQKDEEKNFMLSRLDKLRGAIRSQTIGVKNVFIAVTGDIAFSGNELEYLHAQKFFTNLITNISLEDQKNVNLILIPGNHDCCFSGDQIRRDELIDSIIKTGQVNDDTLDNCLEIQCEFNKFREGMVLPNKIDEKSQVFQIQNFLIDNKRIAFYLFNTAWMSTIHEQQGKLIFPLDKIITENSEEIFDEIVISMLHHPYLWFESNNSRKLRDNLDRISDIILTGHEHESGSYEKINRDGETIGYVEGGVLQENLVENSQFNIIKIDSDGKWQEISTLTWSQQDQMYKVDSEPMTLKFYRNQNRPTTGFLLQGNFEKDLDDIGIKYSHPSTETILLSDLYIFPHLRKLYAANSHQLDNTIIREQIPLFIINNKNVLIIGAEKSGKTALSKILFKYYFELGLLPLLIDGNSIKSCEENRISSLLNRKVSEIYKKPNTMKYFQMEKAKKIIIIDDIQKASLNDKGREKLILTLKDYFETIIIFGNEQVRFSSLISKSNGGSLATTFVECEIMGMGHVKRSELIKKWYLLGQNQFTIQEEELTKNIVRAEKMLSSLLGTNFLPPYPFFILAILQQLEAKIPVNTSSGSYGYLYEALLTIALAKISTKNIAVDTLYSYLSELAFHFYSERITSISENNLRLWHHLYCDKYKLIINLDKIIEGLVEVSILKAETIGLSFRYPYIYYYFVGRYIRDHINESEVRNLIQRISERLHQTDSANIVIFLCHLSKDPFIFDTLLSKSRNLFNKYPEFDLKTDTEFLSNMLSDIPSFILTEENPENNRVKELEKKDQAEEKECVEDREGEYDTTDKSDFDLEEFMQINVAIKNVQILGQLLKNFPGSWQGNQKFILVQECYSLGFRVLKFIFTSVDENKEGVVQRLAELLKIHNPQWDSEKIFQSIRIHIFGLLEGMTYGIIKYVADSVGHDSFSLTFEELLNKYPQNISYKFIDLSVKMDYYKDFPKTQIFDLARTVHKNNFATFLLQYCVWYYFYIYKTDYFLRQSVCSKLGIKLPQKLTSGKTVFQK